MTNEELFAATTVKTWTTVIARLEKILSSLSDDDLQSEVAPRRNRVYYILGHLTAHHDRLLPMLGLGERLLPELHELFITNPDRTFPDEHASAELRKMLVEVNAKVTNAIQAMPTADLIKRHEAVSAEDFAKEPLRNRLAVFQIRTSHRLMDWLTRNNEMNRLSADGATTFYAGEYTCIHKWRVARVGKE